jgi:hypothetical protein
VVDVARKINLAEKAVQRLSDSIRKLMYKSGSGGVTTTGQRIPELQESRDALSKEIVYLEQEVIKHFKPGTMTRRSGSRPTVTPFQFPEDIESGKGKEFGTDTMNAMLSSVNEFWIVIPACRRATSDFNPITGTYFKPPSKDDEYADGDSDGRKIYAQQAQNLWDGSFSGPSLPVIYTLLFLCLIATYWGSKSSELTHWNQLFGCITCIVTSCSCVLNPKSGELQASSICHQTWLVSCSHNPAQR